VQQPAIESANAPARKQQIDWCIANHIIGGKEFLTVGNSILLETGHESEIVTYLSWRSACIVGDNENTQSAGLTPFLKSYPSFERQVRFIYNPAALNRVKFQLPEPNSAVYTRTNQSR
jgi:hypothetical protein